MAGQFVDCSSNNPIPDLSAYKAAGHDTLCRKVTEGTGYHWEQGDAIADAAHSLGLTVGHYHWLRPDTGASAQAAFFIAHVRAHVRPGDWLMTDFERTYENGAPIQENDAQRAAQLAIFNQAVRAAFPDHDLYVYTGNWYLAGWPASQDEVRKWPVVMSDYSGTSVLPNPYGLRYVAWQFTDQATVQGFSRPVDYNRWLDAPAAPAAVAVRPLSAATVQEDDIMYELWQIPLKLATPAGDVQPPNAGRVFLVPTNGYAFWASLQDVDVVTRFGKLRNPGQPKTCLQADIDRLNATIRKGIPA